MRGPESKEFRLAFILLLPSILVIGFLFIYPIITIFYTSFFSKALMGGETSYVGFENYYELLVGRYSGQFWNAFRNSLVWTGGSIFMEVLLGLGFALLLHQKLKGRAFARGAFLFPYVIPIIVAVLIWQFMLNDVYGIVNIAFEKLGIIKSPILFFSSPENAMVSIILVAAWRYYPFLFIALLARLQLIPLSLYDAANVDGANAWQRFRHVTFPSLRVVLVITLILRTIWTFNDFTVIYMLTGGGPLSSTETLPIFNYRLTFSIQNLGLASAGAVITFVVLMIFMIAYLKLLKRMED